jgi:hypothetical protein
MRAWPSGFGLNKRFTRARCARNAHLVQTSVQTSGGVTSGDQLPPGGNYRATTRVDLVDGTGTRRAHPVVEDVLEQTAYQAVTPLFLPGLSTDQCRSELDDVEAALEQCPVDRVQRQLACE